jgi:hypothetical protein
MNWFLCLIVAVLTTQLSIASTINCQTTYKITSESFGKTKHETELAKFSAESAGEACIKAEAEVFKAQFGQTTVVKKLAKLDCTEKIGAVSKKLEIAACD